MLHRRSQGESPLQDPEVHAAFWSTHENYKTEHKTTNQEDSSAGMKPLYLQGRIHYRTLSIPKLHWLVVNVQYEDRNIFDVSSWSPTETVYFRDRKQYEKYEVRYAQQQNTSYKELQDDTSKNYFTEWHVLEKMHRYLKLQKDENLSPWVPKLSF